MGQTAKKHRHYWWRTTGVDDGCRGSKIRTKLGYTNPQKQSDPAATIADHVVLGAIADASATGPTGQNSVMWLALKMSLLTYLR